MEGRDGASRATWAGWKGREWIESSPQEKNLGTLMGKRLDRTRGNQNPPYAGLIPSMGRGEGGILPLCLAQVRPYLQSCLQPWVPA